MPVSKRSVVRIPSYLLHKPSGQARVRINGKDHYLGPYLSEESRVRYGQLIAQHVSGVVQAETKPVDPLTGSNDPDAGLTINELVLAFMRHPRQHYRKNGKETSEVHCLKAATRWLIELYGFTAVDSFGPLMLKAVRHAPRRAENNFRRTAKAIVFFHFPLPGNFPEADSIESTASCERVKRTQRVPRSKGCRMSIDVESESLIPFCDARTAFPGGKRLSLATLHRWRLTGVRGIKLETVLIGGSRYTSAEAISRFVSAQNADESPSPPKITAGQRRRQSEAARESLSADFGV